MNVKSFFGLMLKLLGIYYVIQGIMVLPQFVTLMGMATLKLPNFNPMFFGLFVSLLFYVFIGIFLIVKTDKITGWVIKENGDTVDIHMATILSVALIVIGGLMIVNEVPVLIVQLINKLSPSPVNNIQQGYWLASVVKIGIGYLLVAYNNRIVAWVESRSKK